MAYSRSISRRSSCEASQKVSIISWRASVQVCSVIVFSPPRKCQAGPSLFGQHIWTPWWRPHDPDVHVLYPFHFFELAVYLMQDMRASRTGWAGQGHDQIDLFPFDLHPVNESHIYNIDPHFGVIHLLQHLVYRFLTRHPWALLVL